MVPDKKGQDPRSRDGRAADKISLHDVKEDALLDAKQEKVIVCSA